MRDAVPSPMPQERSLSHFDSRVDELSTHLRQISDELAAERDARAKEKKQGISVTRLHVPLVMWLLTVGPLIGGGITAGMFVSATKTHVANKQIHADESEAIAKGGIAYEADIDAKVASAISDHAKNDRSALRLMLTDRPLTCSAPHGKAKTQDCKFGDQPEWNR